MRKKKRGKKEKTTLKEKFFKIKDTIVLVSQEVVFFIKFLILLFFVFWAFVFEGSVKKKLNKPVKSFKKRKNIFKDWYFRIYNKALKIFDKTEPNEVKNSDLILLAMKNLFSKKGRTYVTIGGMAIGFGAVILLLSAGYGFEKLVISQVASLSEMKQIEVTASQGSPLSFNAEVIGNISEIENVDTIVPIITSVSKVTYNNATSDVIGYGVTNRYFEETGLTTINGKLFDEESSNLEANVKTESSGIVAGASSTIISSRSMDQDIYDIRYSIYPLIWKAVYEKPDTHSKLLGYTKRSMGDQEASEVWGAKYSGGDDTHQAVDVEGNEYSRWIKDTFSIWEKKICSQKDPDCVDGRYILRRDGENQSVVYGYISQKEVGVERYSIADGSALQVYTGKVVDSVSFDFKVDEYTTLYMDANQKASLMTVLDVSSPSTYDAQLIYGGYYSTEEDVFVLSNTGVKYSYWLKVDLPVWRESDCEELCEKYFTSNIDDLLIPVNLSVYVRASDVNILNMGNESLFGQVLGEQDNVIDKSKFVDIESLIATDEDNIDWVAISEELGTTEKIEIDVKEISDDAQRVVVVNTSMLTLLGLNANEAIGETLDAYFIYDSKLFDRTNYLVESEEVSLEILGVVSDSQTPAFYVPFNDIRVDDMKSVSNIKVVVDNKEDSAEVRSAIEGLGFQTSSVVDTIGGINDLFNSLRIALLILGLIALGVASLGMFNTLTVSLLEKTREVGLLKTMGLKAKEVKILFLAESIIMSISGGVAGLLVGFLVGKILSVLISILALSQGQGILNVTYIPWELGVSLIVFASIVGVITGWYPAERATKVSALNALRYE